MRLVKTREEFVNNFKNVKAIPVDYPCIVRSIDYDGGLGGPYTAIKHYTIPITILDIESYFDGFKRGVIESKYD